MTQHSADCSGTCFNRWSRLESVITSARGLEKRGCLPGAVWSPLPFSSKSQQQGTSPSMSDGRSGEETREGRQRGLLTHSPGQLSAPLLLRYLHFSLCFFLFFLSATFCGSAAPLSSALAVAVSLWCTTRSRTGAPVQRVYVVRTAAPCLPDFTVSP